MLTQLCGVGEGGVTTLVTEVSHREFANREHLASYLGQAPAHPFAQQVLAEIDIAHRLRRRHPALANQLHRLELELAPKSSVFHRLPSVLLSHLNLVSVRPAAAQFAQRPESEGLPRLIA